MSNTDKNGDVDIFLNMLRNSHLYTDRTKREVETFMQMFSVLKSNVERVDFAYKLLDVNRVLPTLVTDRKSNEKAGYLRQKGNDMFKVQKNEEAAEFYTRSIACAENKSECLALAYANRSAVLFQYGFYEECLMDIEQAFENNYPERLKPKLLARQEKANTLKPNQTPRNYFEPIPTIPEENKNALIESAADSVEIKWSENLGRHVVTTRDISAGEIIAIEKPFCYVLIAHHYCHCHECVKLCYNLIPCENCTQTLYCSVECRHNAKYYHKYECPLLLTLKNMILTQWKLLDLKIALSVKDQFQTLKVGYGDQGTEGTVYRSDRYKEIYQLVTHSEDRPVRDLLERAAIAAVFFHMVKTYTPFFDQVEEETVFKELFLSQLQIGACNGMAITELAENKDRRYVHTWIGAAIYSFLSMFNNSCSNNILTELHGSTLVLRALQSIKKGDQCYVCYGWHYTKCSRSERRAKIKSQFYFDCSCEACQNDWPLYENLPEISTDFKISHLDLVELYNNGDVNATKKFLAKNLPKLAELDKFQPNRNFAGLQTAVQQCFWLLGNIRRTW